MNELIKIQTNFKDKKINIFKCAMIMDTENYQPQKIKIPIIDANHHDLLEIISYNEIGEIWIAADLLTNDQIREAIDKFSKMPADLHILSSGKNNTVFDKYFKLPLIEHENELFKLPDLEYDAEFSISSKNICDILSQMSLFGDVVNFKCNDDGINILTDGLSGEMLVKLPINEISEYSIVEEEEIDVSYSLTYVNKMILTNKLSSEIEFCLIKDAPMKVKYSLDNESYLIFYIAPKIS
jgi:hypothetical protein